MISLMFKLNPGRQPEITYPTGCCAFFLVVARLKIVDYNALKT